MIVLPIENEALLQIINNQTNISKWVTVFVRYFVLLAMRLKHIIHIASKFHSGFYFSQTVAAFFRRLAPHAQADLEVVPQELLALIWRLGQIGC